jgi:hypothetical protein
LPITLSSAFTGSWFGFHLLLCVCCCCCVMDLLFRLHCLSHLPYYSYILISNLVFGSSQLVSLMPLPILHTLSEKSPQYLFPCGTFMRCW